MAARVVRVTIRWRRQTTEEDQVRERSGPSPSLGQHVDDEHPVAWRSAGPTSGAARSDLRPVEGRR
jgi:hypothetical protein